MNFLLCSAKLQLHRTCIIFSVIRFQTNFLDETMELFRALRNPPWEKTELRYVQWMAETKEKIEHVLLKDTEVPRLLQTCFMHLEVKSSISEFSIFPTELKTSYTYMHSNYVRNKRQKNATKSPLHWGSLSIKYLSSSEGVQIIDFPMGTNCAPLLADLSYNPMRLSLHKIL